MTLTAKIDEGEEEYKLLQFPENRSIRTASLTIFGDVLVLWTLRRYQTPNEAARQYKLSLIYFQMMFNSISDKLLYSCESCHSSECVYQKLCTVCNTLVAALVVNTCCLKHNTIEKPERTLLHHLNEDYFVNSSNEFVR